MYQRSGKLAFCIWTHATGERGHWGDGKSNQLEGLLPQCITAIFRTARQLWIEDELRRQRELEWECQSVRTFCVLLKQRRRGLRREQEERIRKAQEEEERLQEFEEWVANWQKAEGIRVRAHPRRRARLVLPG